MSHRQVVGVKDCTVCLRVAELRLCASDGAHRNSDPCGTANEGGSPTKLMVSEYAPAFRKRPAVRKRSATGRTPHP